MMSGIGFVKRALQKHTKKPLLKKCIYDFMFLRQTLFLKKKV